MTDRLITLRFKRSFYWSLCRIRHGVIDRGSAVILNGMQLGRRSGTAKLWARIYRWLVLRDRCIALLFFLGQILPSLFDSLPLGNLLRVLSCSCTISLSLPLRLSTLRLLLSAAFFLLCGSSAFYVPFLFELALCLFLILSRVSRWPVTRPAVKGQRGSPVPSSFQRQSMPLAWTLRRFSYWCSKRRFG